MGQYGSIQKIIVKTEGNRDSSSVGVYVSFSSPNEASIAILVHNDNNICLNNESSIIR